MPRPKRKSGGGADPAPVDPELAINDFANRFVSSNGNFELFDEMATGTCVAANHGARGEFVAAILGRGMGVEPLAGRILAKRLPPPPELPPASAMPPPARDQPKHELCVILVPDGVANDAIERMVTDVRTAAGAVLADAPLTVTTEKTPGQDRGVAYAGGGLVVVHPRLLCADLLRHRVAPKAIHTVMFLWRNEFGSFDAPSNFSASFVTRLLHEPDDSKWEGGRRVPNVGPQAGNGDNHLTSTNAFFITDAPAELTVGRGSQGADAFTSSLNIADVVLFPRFATRLASHYAKAHQTSISGDATQNGKPAEVIDIDAEDDDEIQIVGESDPLPTAADDGTAGWEAVASEIKSVTVELDPTVREIRRGLTAILRALADELSADIARAQAAAEASEDGNTAAQIFAPLFGDENEEGGGNGQKKLSSKKSFGKRSKGEKSDAIDLSVNALLVGQATGLDNKLRSLLRASKRAAMRTKDLVHSIVSVRRLLRSVTSLSPGDFLLEFEEAVKPRPDQRRILSALAARGQPVPRRMIDEHRPLWVVHESFNKIAGLAGDRAFAIAGAGGAPVQAEAPKTAASVDTKLLAIVHMIGNHARSELRQGKAVGSKRRRAAEGEPEDDNAAPPQAIIVAVPDERSLYAVTQSLAYGTKSFSDLIRVQHEDFKLKYRGRYGNNPAGHTKGSTAPDGAGQAVDPVEDDPFELTIPGGFGATQQQATEVDGGEDGGSGNDDVPVVTKGPEVKLEPVICSQEAHRALLRDTDSTQALSQLCGGAVFEATASAEDAIELTDVDEGQEDGAEGQFTPLGLDVAVEYIRPAIATKLVLTLPGTADGESRPSVGVPVIILQRSALTPVGLLAMTARVHRQPVGLMFIFSADLALMRTIEGHRALIANKENEFNSPMVIRLEHPRSVENKTMQILREREQEAILRWVEVKSSLSHQWLAGRDSRRKADAELGFYQRVIDGGKRQYRKSTLYSEPGVIGMATTSVRHADGPQHIEEAKPTVIVDERELRCPVPFHLHSLGLELVLLTLVSGDYVLSPGIAVERKNVTDLIGSLNSGRLARQMEGMSHRFERAIVLVEFSRNQKFTIQDHCSSAQHRQRIVLKLCKLVTATRRMRLMWARTQLHGAKQLSWLKGDAAKDNAEADNPDLTAETDKSPSSVAIRVLKRFPGVTSANARALMDSARSLSGLASLSEAAIIEAIGPENGAKLHKFLHQPLVVSL